MSAVPVQNESFVYQKSQIEEKDTKKISPFVKVWGNLSKTGLLLKKPMNSRKDIEVLEEFKTYAIAVFFRIAGCCSNVGWAHITGSRRTYVLNIANLKVCSGFQTQSICHPWIKFGNWWKAWQISKVCLRALIEIADGSRINAWLVFLKFLVAGGQTIHFVFTILLARIYVLPFCEKDNLIINSTSICKKSRFWGFDTIYV